MIDYVSLNTVWKSHAGGDVSDCAPKFYSMVPNPDGSATFSVSGTTVLGKYAGAEWYEPHPIPPGTHACCMTYQTVLNADSLTTSQANESDIILTDKQGFKYNKSFQRARKSLQIADVKGNWQTFATMPSQLTPLVPHVIQIFHTFDFIKKISSTVAVAIDADVYLVPLAMQNIPAAKSNWTDYMQAMIQIQEELTLSAGTSSEMISKLTLVWD